MKSILFMEINRMFDVMRQDYVHVTHFSREMLMKLNRASVTAQHISPLQ